MPLVERNKDRIWLKWDSGYVPKGEFDRRKRQAERIVGSSFRRKDQVWTYPLDLVTCRDLREAFGDTLTIGPALGQWAREEVEKEKRLLELITARDSDNLTRLPKAAPNIWAAMNDDRCIEPGCSGLHSKGHQSTHEVVSHRYQKPAVEYMVTARRCQNASQPGLGKTIETLAAIVESGLSGLVLVAAPRTSLRTVWEPEIKRWLPGVPVFATTGGQRRRLDTLNQAIKLWHGGRHSLVFVIINPEMLQTKKIEECLECDGSKEAHSEDHKVMTYYEHKYPILFEQTWSGFVVDETHKYILNVNLRTKRATQVGTGAMLIKLATDPMKIALSGTPWKGRVRNAWSVKHWLDGDVGLSASFWNWANRMLHVEEGEYSKHVGDVSDEETFNRWCDSFMIRHTKAEMASWLPPKFYAGNPLDPKDPHSPIGIWLEMDEVQDRAYRAMEQDAAVQLESGLLIGNGVLAEMTRLKQFASMYGDIVTKVVKGEEVKTFMPKLPSNKYDWILQALDERGINKDPSGDSKVVIAGQFTKMINVIHAGLKKEGIDSFMITGETPERMVEQYVKQFQDEGGPRVCLLNTMKGGVSITLDAADDLFFFDETWVPDDQEQTEDRLHRTSRIHSVNIYYVRSLDTIDERIAWDTQGKDDLQKRLLDGKRGVEYAKRLLGRDK